MVATHFAKIFSTKSMWLDLTQYDQPLSICAMGAPLRFLQTFGHPGYRVAAFFLHAHDEAQGRKLLHQFLPHHFGKLPMLLLR